MKTQQYFLIFLIFFPWILEGQPLADLSGMKVGDSVVVEVIANKRRSNCLDINRLVKEEIQRERYNYSLLLTEKEKGFYTFKLELKRIRVLYRAKFEQHELYKRRGFAEFDTDFDRSDFRRKVPLEHLNKVYTLVHNPKSFNEKFRILDLEWAADSVIDYAYSICDESESKRISTHLRSIFITEKIDIDVGSVVSVLKYPKAIKPVSISGRIEHSLSHRLHISGTPDRNNLHELDREILLDDQGYFETSLNLKKASFLYFFHEKKQKSDSTVIAFPLYMEPGDSIHFSLNTKEPEVIGFEGKNKAKYETFDKYTSRFLGSKLDHVVDIEPFGIISDFYDWSHSVKYYPATKLDPSLIKKQNRLYQEAIRFLDDHKAELGANLYYKLKAEVVYSHGIFQLYANNRESNSLNTGTSRRIAEQNLFGLTLTNTFGYGVYSPIYFLDSLDLRIEEILSSLSYPKYLSSYLETEVVSRNAQEKVNRGWFINDPLADYAFQGIPLHTYLKEDILSWMAEFTERKPQDHEGNNLLNYNRQKQRLVEFKKICQYQPFLDQINYISEQVKRTKKGQIAPDLRLSEEKSLRDYFGQKIALVVFDSWSSSINQMNDLAITYPDVKFIFFNVNPDAEESTKDIARVKLNGPLYFYPGYGLNGERPYFAKPRSLKIYLIDERRTVFGTFEHNLFSSRIYQEVKALSSYQFNPIADFWKVHKNQITQIFYSFLFFLTCWLVYWYFFIRRKRIVEFKKRIRIETELRAIRSQMNPHFLFNSLSSVQNLINQSDKEKANHYLGRFSQLVRKVLNHSEQALIPLEEELKVVDLYCELEALRFKFDYQIEVDSDIDAQTMEIPSMLIQPYVENSIRHGLATQGSRGFIGVYVRKQLDCILIEIEDNGIGIRKHQEEFVGHVEKSGFGLRLSDERVKKINERYKMKIEVKIFDRRDEVEPSHGTRVLIHIPLEK